MPLERRKDADVENVIHPRLRADDIRHVEPGKLRVPGLRCIESIHDAIVALHHLVPVYRILQVVRERRPQVELVANDIRRDLRLIGVCATDPVEDKARATSLPTVRRVQASEAIDQSATDCALRNLVSRVPLAAVRHCGQRPVVAVRSTVVAKYAVDPVVVVRHVKRAIVVIHLARAEQGAAGQIGRTHQQRAPIAVRAVAKGCRRVDLIDQAHAHRAGRREITFVGVVRSLLVVQVGYQLRDQEVEV